MADTTIAGHKVPKWGVYAGIGVVVVGGVLYLRKKNSGSSASSASGSSASGTDPVTGLPYSEDNQVDPATGLTYLSEAEQYGSVAAAEAAVGAGYGGVSASGEGYSGLGYGYPTYSPTETTNGAYATNAAWAQAVQAGLPGITGDSANNVATAIGNYLGGLALTAAQANDIQVAIAEYGPPPSGNLQIIQASSASGATSTGSSTSPSSGASTTSGTPASTTTPAVAGQLTPAMIQQAQSQKYFVPNVVGLSGNDAAALVRAAGLTPYSNVLPPVPGGGITPDIVTWQAPPPGQYATPTDRSAGFTVTFGNLPPGSPVPGVQTGGPDPFGKQTIALN